MKHLRIGLIGCGGMGAHHLNTFSQIDRLRFTACADIVPANVKHVSDEHAVTGFSDGTKLLDSGLVDAVLVATPHYDHPKYAMAAMKRGIHVLTEKPVAVTAKAAAQVNACHKQHRRIVYAVMYQMRTVPLWQAVKKLIDEGRLGKLQRVSYTLTDWFRAQAYFDAGTWRATWAGEGGGVLVNQCPHNLDLLCWLVGSPARVHAHLGLGKYHNIEVEDEVTAYLEYPGGATGIFITSTGEAPGSNLMELCGNQGKISVAPGKPIDFIETAQPVDQFIRRSKNPFGRPQSTTTQITPPDGGGHVVLTQNFVNAVLDGEPLLAPGTEGLAAIELANAMIMSGVTGRPINIPTPRTAYEKLLKDLAAKARRARPKRKKTRKRK